MNRVVSATEARQAWADVLTEVLRNRHPIAIERRGEFAFLLGGEELDTLLADRMFNPEVFFEDAAVSVWLPELALYGGGGTFEEARADLLDEVRDYVDEYVADFELYRRSPNRAAHFGHVMRALVADAVGRLEDVVFATPADVAAEPVAAA
jgi:hypothetical protein